MEIEGVHQINFLYLIAAFVAVLLIQSLLFQPTHVKEIPYSEFQKLADKEKVADLVVGPTTITGTLKDAKPTDIQHFSTVRVEPSLAETLAKDNLTFSGEPGPGLLQTVLGWLMPTLGFVLLWIFLIRPMSMGQGAGGLIAIGKSKARVFVERDIKITFADVAGVDEAKDELKEVVSFLKDPQNHGRLGARMPKRVLLVGPPGTGKTLLARAVAGEAGLPFFSISGSEFVEMFVGVGAARVRDLFEQARKQAPAIVFKATSYIVMMIICIGLGISSAARAENASQSITSHGFTVYFGVVPAEIAQGVVRSHGDANMHGARSESPATYHLIVAIFNAVTGDRITDATVTASVTRPGFEPPSKPLEPMKIVDEVTYGNVFDFPGDGIYRIRLSIARKGNSRPTKLDLTYDHGHP